MVNARKSKTVRHEAPKSGFPNPSSMLSFAPHMGAIMAKTSLPTGIATLAAAGGAAIAVTAGAQPRPAGGTVTYWMSAESTSGLMASGANPAARPSAWTWRR